MTAIRPPELAPRLDYAALLLAADRVVLADTFPLSRQSGHSRMRIRTSQGAQWLTVPRRHGGRRQRLDAVETVVGDWRRRHRAAIRSAYGMAPFYAHVAPGWSAVLDTPGGLADLTVASVRWAAQWLGSEAEIVRASALASAPETLAAVAGAAGVETLLTLPESAASDAAALPDLEVRTLHYREPERRQSFPGFVASLSVLDVVMNYGPAAGDLVRTGIDGT